MAEKEFIVAIELGSSKVTGIAGQKKPDGSISVLALVKEDSSQFIRKGVVYNIDKTAQCLTSIIKKLETILKTRITQVFVGVGGQSIRGVRNVVSKEMPADTIKAYDISLMKNGKAVQPDHVVTVKIPCDDPDAKVYRQETDGSLTDMNAIYRDGYLVFKTTHFSVYIVATGAEVDIAICGDADGDGEVTITDATVIQRTLAGIKSNADPDVIARNGDVDGDSKVNVIDVTLIQRKLAGLPVSYPIGEAL